MWYDKVLALVLDILMSGAYRSRQFGELKEEAFPRFSSEGGFTRRLPQENRIKSATTGRNGRARAVLCPDSRCQT